MKYEKFWKEEKYSKIKESETIDYLIAPIMREELGWDREDPEIVKSQWRKVSGNEKENPVDFALFRRGEENPVMLLECKKIGEKLEGKNVTQAVTYCLTSNVRWCILTNGVEWKLYDTMDLSKDILDREVLYVDIRESGVEKLKCLGVGELDNMEKIVGKSKVEELLKKIDWVGILMRESGVKDRVLVESCYKESLGKKEEWEDIKGVVVTGKVSCSGVRVIYKGKDERVEGLKKWSELLVSTIEVLHRYGLESEYIKYSGRLIGGEEVKKDYLSEGSIVRVGEYNVVTHSGTESKLRVLKNIVSGIQGLEIYVKLHQ